MVSPRSEKEKEDKAQLRHGPGTSGLDGIRGGSIIKSTEEEKELLGERAWECGCSCHGC